MSDKCEFCKIVGGESPETVIEYDDDEVVVFKDFRPASEHHFLAVSKKHIRSAKCLTSEDEPLLKKLEEALKQVLQEKNANLNDSIYGFHWPPFITIQHLHMHAISPVSEIGFLAKMMFKPNSLWFCTAEYVRNRIKANK